MRTYNLRCEMLAKQSIQQVFKVFEDPHNLAKITPASLSFEITSKEQIVMRPGAEIEYRIKVAGIPLHWKSEITEYEPPFRFVDEQRRGPYQTWRHTHSFRPTQEGTVVADNVNYSLPLDPFSRLAHAVMVRKQLLEIFRFRQTALDVLLGGGTVRLVEPVITVQS